MSVYKHWQLDIDNQVVWLGFNKENAAVNSVSNAVLDELNGVLHEVAQKKDAKGLIIYSLKNNGFIAGADISEIAALENSDEAVEFLRKGQVVFSHLESLAIPTVAMIDGFCLGGGYELALACDYRVASDTKQTRIGLPEVLLGIHPGWGGTVRLPSLIGGFQALSQVMLTGKGIAAKRAKQMGMIDDAVPVRQLKRAALWFIEHKPTKHKPSFIHSLTNHRILRAPIAALVRRQVAKKVRAEHYPAPYAIIDLWEKEGGIGERAYLKEIDSVEQLIDKNNTSKNLIRAFQLRERMKGFSKKSDFKAKRVHVIGAGVMGGDIAAWCALSGMNVTLQDVSYDRIAPAIARAGKLFKKKLKQSRLVQAANDKLIADPDGLGVKHADVIIEAVYEKLEVKHEIISMIEKQASKDAIIATNTSSIPLDEISEVMKSPERLIGIHFFNPVAKMELVEVVHGKKTSAKTVDDACAFVGQINRVPLPVTSSPGFLINRVLMPYLMECVQLLDEGYQKEVIDEAAKSFGMMMGPVELADTVGLDVCVAVAENLTHHFGGSVPQRLYDMIKDGKLGRKTDEGFYKYKSGKPVSKIPGQINSDTLEEISNRLILRMINEAAVCLREGVVEDEDLLDGGMIFATGFAPFRGGPMHYAADFGKDKLNELFATLASKHGDRFKSDVI